MLPSLIVLKAAEDRYVLVSLVQSNYVEATVVENSKHLFTHAEWRSDGLEGQPRKYEFKRVSSRSTPKIYTSTLYKTRNYILVSWHEPIYIYTMTYSGTILPSAYFQVFSGDDTSEIWHFKKEAVSPPSSPSVSPPSSPSVSPPSSPSGASPAKIPPHIVRGFVESAIQKNEVCPITLDPLVIGQIAMTSCGHLFERQSLMNMLNSACPTCRVVIQKEELVHI
jgi:hypothetical protein